MGVDFFLGDIRPPEFPIVRFYTWNCPTISYGCHQKPDRRINMTLCLDNGIPVVARPTGGRELLHGHDLCYSVIWPYHEKISAVEAKGLFAGINDALLLGLKKIGINAEWNEFRNKPRAMDGPCFAQIDSGEISINSKKLIASAQRVFEHAVVQQGSLPLWKPDVELPRYLQHADKDSIIRKLAELSTDISEQLGNNPGPDFIVQNLTEGFNHLFQCRAENGEKIFIDYLRNIVV